MKKAITVMVVLLVIAVSTSGRGCSIAEYMMGKAFPVTDYKIGNVEITEHLLTVNEYSRPGYELENINGIVIHYTGNPGTTAEANRNYFQTLAYDRTAYASAHFVIGLEGEVVQCIPLDEQDRIVRAIHRSFGHLL